MAGKSTPRNWTRLDLAYLEQDTVRTLGDTFGPGGPLAFACIILEAKRAAMAGAPVDEQGTLSMRFGALARSAFVSEDEARGIVAACVRLELLELLDDTDARFRAKLTKWSSWEPRDSAGAGRQRGYRQRHTEADEYDDDGFGY